MVGYRPDGGGWWPPRPESAAARNQLGELYGVERGALAQVVVRAEQREAVLDGLVGPDPAHERRVRSRRLQRCRYVGQGHAWRAGQQLPRPGRAEWPGEPG